MKFKKKNLIRWFEYLPPLPHLRPHLRLLPRLRPRLRLHLHRGDLGIILEAIEAKDAWEDFDTHSKEEQEQIPNCYMIYFLKHETKLVVYEGEIELCDSRID